MTYETMDWELEAKRVARAFGVEGEVEFAFMRFATVKGLKLAKETDLSKIWLELSDGGMFYCDYSEGFISFSLVPQGGEQTSFSFHDDGTIDQGPVLHKDVWPHPLFHLGLLTPEVEARLGVPISAHEKLEWLRDYEERYGL